MIRIFVILMSLALAFPTVSTFAQEATDVAALADFGNPEPDDELFDVQTITDAMMTTQQKLGELGIRFLLNLVVCWILVQFFYYRKSRRRDYYFTFMIFSSAMLALLYVMGSVSVGVGMTLGLFAIFGVIRYRTETVPIREMTYLFIIIALACCRYCLSCVKRKRSHSVSTIHAPPIFQLAHSGLLFGVLSPAGHVIAQMSELCPAHHPFPTL